MINCKNVCKTYKNVKVLDIQDLELNEYGVVGLIGPNGAGKTTLLKILAGNIKPDKQSEVQVFGQNPFNNISLLQKVGLFHDDLSYYGSSLGKLLDEYAFLYPKFDLQKATKLLEFFNLPSTKKFRELSKGMKAQFICVVAVSCNFEILLLDEPTAFMDRESRFLFEQLIAQEKQANNKLIIISTHLAGELANVIDDAVVIKKGKVALHQKVNLQNAKELLESIQLEEDKIQDLEAIYER